MNHTSTRSEAVPRHLCSDYQALVPGPGMHRTLPGGLKAPVSPGERDGHICTHRSPLGKGRDKSCGMAVPAHIGRGEPSTKRSLQVHGCVLRGRQGSSDSPRSSPVRGSALTRSCSVLLCVALQPLLTQRPPWFAGTAPGRACCPRVITERAPGQRHFSLSSGDK